MTTAELLNSEAVVSVIVGIFGLITATFTALLARQHKALKGVREDTAVAREQTANSHKTNLRDDIDRVLAGIAGLQRGQERHDQQIADIRTDLAWERRERMDLARVVTGHHPIA